jgi:DNA replication protein DnaD
MQYGWIKLHRQITEHWLWEEKPFSKGQAWIDLLLQANHQDKKAVIGNDIIEVKRGSFVTSIRKLSERWGWSNTKIKNFLNLLQNDGMISYFSDAKKTVITIENYSLYQDLNDTKTTQKRQTSDTETTQKHTNKNDKNDKNEKNIKNKNLTEDEEIKIVLEKRRQLEEEKKRKLEEFNKLPKEEQERYINIAKNFITNNNKQRGIYLISDYLKEEAK